MAADRLSVGVMDDPDRNAGLDAAIKGRLCHGVGRKVRDINSERLELTTGKPEEEGTP